MSEQPNDDQLENLLNDSGESQENVPKALRDAYNRQKQEKEELQQKVAEYEKAQKDAAVKDFVKDKNLPDKAINLIGDSDPEQWYAEYGELFAAESGAGEGEGSAVPPEQVEQIKQVANVQPGVYTPDSGEEMHSKLDEIYSGNLSEKERHARLKEMGAM